MPGVVLVVVACLVLAIVFALVVATWGMHLWRSQLSAFDKLWHLGILVLGFFGSLIVLAVMAFSNHPHA